MESQSESSSESMSQDQGEFMRLRGCKSRAKIMNQAGAGVNGPPEVLLTDTVIQHMLRCFMI